MKTAGSDFRRDFFYLLDYVTRRSKKKLVFQKKKKKDFAWHHCKIVSGIIRNQGGKKYFERSLSFGKLHKDVWEMGYVFFCCCFFVCFAITDLKNFSRCNVIQQIKITLAEHVNDVIWFPCVIYPIYSKIWIQIQHFDIYNSGSKIGHGPLGHK